MLRSRRLEVLQSINKYGEHRWIGVFHRKKRLTGNLRDQIAVVLRDLKHRESLPASRESVRVDSQGRREEREFFETQVTKEAVCRPNVPEVEERVHIEAVEAPFQVVERSDRICLEKLIAETRNTGDVISMLGRLRLPVVAKEAL